MIKRILLLACWGGFALCLSGCGVYGREPEDTVLAQIIGVDVDVRGVNVTAAGADGEETVLASASGETLEAAFSALPTAGDKYFSLTNVTDILVGDGVDLTHVLKYVVDDPDMSYMAKVWSVGDAGGLMEGLKENGLGRFQVLEQGGKETVTVKSTLAGLLSAGEAALAVLGTQENKLAVVGTLYYNYEVR